MRVGQIVRIKEKGRVTRIGIVITKRRGGQRYVVMVLGKYPDKREFDRTEIDYCWGETLVHFMLDKHGEPVEEKMVE